MTPDLGTTRAIYASIRDAILGFVPEGATPGVATEDVLTGGLYIVQPPDNAVAPYGTIRLQNRNTSGEHQGERDSMDLEVLLWGLASEEQYDLEDLGDRVDEALLRFRLNSSGVIFGRGRQRDSLPRGTNPTDHNVVGLRLLFPLAVWPQYLTRYAQGATP